MFARIARHTLELHRHIPDFLRRAVLFKELHQLLLLLQCLRQGHAHFKGDQFGHTVRETVGLTLYPRHIAHHRFGGHGAEGNDLRHRLAAIGLRHILNDFIAALHAEIHVEVRHRDPLRIQKALKQQVVFDRIEVGDLQCIGHQRPCTRASAGANRNILLLGPANKVHDHEEITGEAHLVDGIKLKLKTLTIGFQLLLVPFRKPPLQPLMR